MSYDAWKRIRNAVSLGFLVSGVMALGHYFEWWDLKLAAPAVLLVLIVCGAGVMVIGDNCRDANKREQRAREERTQKEYEDKHRAESARYARIMSARDKAVQVAKADYPDHFDDEALYDRGWTSLVHGEEIIDAYLDAPDIILKFDVPGETEQSELRLYERERVLKMEKDDPTVRQEIARVQQERWDDEQAERYAREREEDEARKAAERDARIAKQKVINISDKL